jgi:hypothetical protein
MYLWYDLCFVKRHLLFNHLRHLHNIFNDFPDFNCLLLDQFDWHLLFERYNDFSVTDLHIMYCYQSIYNSFCYNGNLSFANDLHRYPSFNLHFSDDLPLLFHNHDFVFVGGLHHSFFDWIWHSLLHNFLHLIGEVDWYCLLNLDDL